jgi:hypothetical protein
MAKRHRKSKDMSTLTEALYNLEKSTGENFETLDGQLLKNYQTMGKLMTKEVLNIFVPTLDTIGKLQLLRKQVVQTINFTSRVESAHYTNCLKTLNTSMLENLNEIKSNAIETLKEEAEEAAAEGGNAEATSRTLN